MQTRRQAALAAAAQAVVQPAAIVPPPLNPASNATNIWAPLFACSLSDLTPASSFVSDAGTVPDDAANRPSTEAETEDDLNDEGQSSAVATAARNFGVPQFVVNRGRSLETPVQSQSDRYPAEVFETPRKNSKLPTQRERRAAQWVRDSELATGLAQLTRNGTLLVPHDPSPEAEHRGIGLRSAFASPSASPTQQRSTRKAAREEKTRVINLPEDKQGLDKLWGMRL
ncbi:hypothetical protein C8R43DRAFT_1116229 [Mycena crocata]|nr:hypothetical protein C8R43DRAFT_1116229 [Mycena crocata]